MRRSPADVQLSALQLLCRTQFAAGWLHSSQLAQHLSQNSRCFASVSDPEWSNFQASRETGGTGGVVSHLTWRSIRTGPLPIHLHGVIPNSALDHFLLVLLLRFTQRWTTPLRPTSYFISLSLLTSVPRLHLLCHVVHCGLLDTPHLQLRLLPQDTDHKTVWNSRLGEVASLIAAQPTHV